MSAEATNRHYSEPQNSQTGGCLPSFLRRFFTPRYPVGLEGFATSLQEQIDNHLAAQQQEEADRRSAEASQQVAEAARNAEAAQRQRELEQKRQAALAEARDILEAFQVGERFRMIRKGVWQGKGQIKSIDPVFNIGTYTSGNHYDRLGGLRLVHQYPLFDLETREVELDGESGGCATEWRYVPKTGETSIGVVVDGKLGSRRSEKVLYVHSEAETGQRRDGTFVYDPRFFTNTINVINVQIPLAEQDSKKLLDSTLAQESSWRLSNNLLPSQLEANARMVSVAVRQRPCWLRWTRNRNDL